MLLPAAEEPQGTKRAADQRHPRTYRILDRRESKFRELTWTKAIALSVLFCGIKARKSGKKKSFNPAPGTAPSSCIAKKTITTDVVVLARCPEEIPASSTNEIRKLPTTHLATSSTRKLRPSVRREGITRRENDANECGRKYY